MTGEPWPDQGYGRDPELGSAKAFPSNQGGEAIDKQPIRVRG